MVFRVATYNLQDFKPAGATAKQTQANLLGTITQVAADVLCLQAISSDDLKNLDLASLGYTVKQIKHNDGDAIPGMAICYKTSSFEERSFEKGNYTTRGGKNVFTHAYVDLFDKVTKKIICVATCMLTDKDGALAPKKQHLQVVLKAMEMDRKVAVDTWILAGDLNADESHARFKHLTQTYQHDGNLSATKQHKKSDWVWARQQLSTPTEGILQKSALLAPPPIPDNCPTATDFVFSSDLVKAFTDLETSEAEKEPAAKILNDTILADVKGQSGNSFDKIRTSFDKATSALNAAPKKAAMTRLEAVISKLLTPRYLVPVAAKAPATPVPAPAPASPSPAVPSLTAQVPVPQLPPVASSTVAPQTANPASNPVPATPPKPGTPSQASSTVVPPPVVPAAGAPVPAAGTPVKPVAPTLPGSTPPATAGTPVKPGAVPPPASTPPAAKPVLAKAPSTTTKPGATKPVNPQLLAQAALVQFPQGTFRERIVRFFKTPADLKDDDQFIRQYLQIALEEGMIEMGKVNGSDFESFVVKALTEQLKSYYKDYQTKVLDALKISWLHAQDEAEAQQRAQNRPAPAPVYTNPTARPAVPPSRPAPAVMPKPVAPYISKPAAPPAPAVSKPAAPTAPKPAPKLAVLPTNPQVIETEEIEHAEPKKNCCTEFWNAIGRFFKRLFGMA